MMIMNKSKFKIIKSLVVFSFIFTLYNSFAQTESKTNVFMGKKYFSFIIKIDSSSIKKFKIVTNANGIPHSNLLDSIQKDNFFLTTTSIVDKNCMPLGFYCVKGNILQPINDSNGIGNFYLKPNGALLITKDEAIVCSSDEINKYNNIRLGIQSGPMLIINDSINKKFNSNSNNKHIRSGVGIFNNKKGEKFIVFSISDTLVSFYDFALFLKNKYNVKNALCLESARSVMNIPFLENKTDDSNQIVCRYIIFDGR